MRLAIVSGGSRGLGLALCLNFSRLGFRVVEFSRSGIKDAPVVSVNADLASPSSSREAFRRSFASLAAEPWDEIIAINNAGTLNPIGPTSLKDGAEVLANMNINFNSAILFLTEVVANFQSHPCRKVLANISSGAAQKGYAGWSLYCAAKAGTEHFIRALALEQAAEASPFTAVNINPGVMDTQMQAAIRGTSESDFPSVQRFVGLQKEGSLRPPSEVAAEVMRIVSSPELAAGTLYTVG